MVPSVEVHGDEELTDWKERSSTAGRLQTRMRQQVCEPKLLLLCDHLLGHGACLLLKLLCQYGGLVLQLLEYLLWIGVATTINGRLGKFNRKCKETSTTGNPLKIRPSQLFAAKLIFFFDPSFLGNLCEFEDDTFPRWSAGSTRKSTWSWQSKWNSTYPVLKRRMGTTRSATAAGAANVTLETVLIRLLQGFYRSGRVAVNNIAKYETRDCFYCVIFVTSKGFFVSF
jgi:hypothetical protein